MSDGIVSPFKCWRCDKVLAESAGPGTSARCLRCGAKNNVPGEPAAATSAAPPPAAAAVKAKPKPKPKPRAAARRGVDRSAAPKASSA